MTEGTSPLSHSISPLVLSWLSIYKIGPRPGSISLEVLNYYQELFSISRILRSLAFSATSIVYPTS